MAPFSKGYNARQFITEFPGKGWTTRSLDRRLVKLKKFGTANRWPGSSWPRSARTDENVDTCIIFGMQFERR